MNNNTEEFIDSKIDSIIKENNIYHIGKVIRINSFIVEATGLEDAFFFEKVYVGNENNIGYVDKIDENKVFIALVKTDGNIKIGDPIKTTGEALQASFSKNAMGMIVDAFGVDRMTEKSFNESKMISIETPKIPIMDRTPVNRPLETGIASIDLMFPIGRGQRQLIIGDKKTGKTQILLDTIINQKGKNVICIYVSIGKTKKEVKRLYSKLVEKGANAYTQIVAVFNDDTSPLIKLTPYVGLSIAEEYMREGYDVLVCIDDLKKHADACREIALISEKNTGREAYPADIFYTHSRLLEKGCQYKNGGSITILPVVETKGGDITDYISTNIISITDGQIVLSEKNFKKGQKPALDFGLSVSRLGGAVQKDSIKKIGALVRQELLSYLETADVYQLVKIDAMSKELQTKVFRGKKILELLCQPKFAPRSEEKLITNFSFILEQDVPADTEDEAEFLDVNNNDDNNNNNGGNAENKVEETVVENNNEQVVNEVIETVVEETPVTTEVTAPVEEVQETTVVEETTPVVETETVEVAQVEEVVDNNTGFAYEAVPTEVVQQPQAETAPVEEVSCEVIQPTEAEVPSIEDVSTEAVETQVVETEPVEVVEETVDNSTGFAYEAVPTEVVQQPETEQFQVEAIAPVVEVQETTQVEVPSIEDVSTEAVATQVVEDATSDIEKLYTVEIPVEGIKQVLDSDEIETLRTTEVPVEQIKKFLETPEDVEQLYTTEIPIIQSVVPMEENTETPVIESSYTVQIPKLGTDEVTQAEQTVPEIYTYSDTDNNGVN